MARRSLSAMLATLMVAVMLGVRDAAGLAPPLPTTSTEEIHWLSPGLEDELDLDVVIAESEEALEVGEDRPVLDKADRGLAFTTRRFFSRLFGRGNG